MRKCLILLLLFFIVFPTQAGHPNNEPFLNRCQTLNSEFDLQTACQQYISYPEQQDCLGQLIVSIMQQCWAKNLSLCEERSTLYATAITDGRNFYNIGAIDPLHASVLAFDAGDYYTAAWIIEAALTTDELRYFPFYTHYLALGIIYSATDEYELALQNYNEAINIHFFSPLPFYFRGKFYEKIGDTDHTYRDYYTYTEFASLHLQQSLTLDYFTYSLPDAEDWVAYPVLSRGDGIIAISIEDLTLQPDFLVAMAWLDNGETLAVINLISDDSLFEYPNIIFLTRDESDLSNYKITMIQQDFPQSTRIQLEVRIFPQNAEYIKKASIFEGGGVTSVLPFGKPDPRINIANRPCADLALSHIQIGDEVVGNYVDGDGFWIMKTEPSDDSDLVFESFQVYNEETANSNTFVVQEGPVCTENSIWWRISSGEFEGWMPESYKNSYLMMPFGLRETWWQLPNRFPSPAELLGLSNESSP